MTKDTEHGYELKNATRAKLAQIFYEDINTPERRDILINVITDFDKYNFVPAKPKPKF